MIGREMVLELQGGEERAEYGKQVLQSLSTRLMKQYGTGFSVANLKNFRQFFLMYPDRLDVIRYPTGGVNQRCWLTDLLIISSLNILKVLLTIVGFYYSR